MRIFNGHSLERTGLILSITLVLISLLMIGYAYFNYKGLDAPAILHAGNRGDW